VKLWLRDIKDDIEGPHLDFLGAPTAFHTALELGQRGPTTFDLRVILLKRDNLRPTSNKMMYKTKHSQHLKLKKGR